MRTRISVEMNSTNRNEGGIDLEACIVAIVGFSAVWIIWTTFSPIINKMDAVATNPGLGLPDKALNKISLYDMVWQNAMLLNAGGWLLYIVYSSIRQEVEARQQRYGYV